MSRVSFGVSCADGNLTGVDHSNPVIVCNNDSVTPNNEQDPEFPTIENFISRNEELERQQERGFPVAEPELRVSEGTTESTVLSVTPEAWIRDRGEFNDAHRDRIMS